MNKNHIDEPGKLFIGGLDAETTTENLHKYFSRYGEVVDSVAIKDKVTGRSRGFGFVKFADPGVIDQVLMNGPHNLDGKRIDPKPCSSRMLSSNKSNLNCTENKVFLGGIPSTVTETELKVFFEQYGKITKIILMHDHFRKTGRGFCFLCYESKESMTKLCEEHFVEFKGKTVEIKPAVPASWNNEINKNIGLDRVQQRELCQEKTLRAQAVTNVIMVLPQFEKQPQNKPKRTNQSSETLSNTVNQNNHVLKQALEECIILTLVIIFASLCTSLIDIWVV